MAKPTSRVSRVLMTGPLVPFADAYRAELRERGYAPLSIVTELRQAARFSRRLEADGLTVAEVSEARVEEFLEWQRANWRHRKSWSRPSLRCLLDMLRGLGVLAAEEPAAPSSPTDVLLARFGRYLFAERGLAAGTVVLYLRSARRFVEGLAPDRGLAELAAGDVTAAVLRESEGVSVSAAQTFVSGLRWFLRFCFVEGLVGSDLSQAALLVRGRSSSPLPRGISGADARALLGACDRRHALGPSHLAATQPQPQQQDDDRVVTLGRGRRPRGASSRAGCGLAEPEHGAEGDQQRRCGAERDRDGERGRRRRQRERCRPEHPTDPDAVDQPPLDDRRDRGGDRAGCDGDAAGPERAA
jgi:site-specific recombinase XerD